MVGDTFSQIKKQSQISTHLNELSYYEIGKCIRSYLLVHYCILLFLYHIQYTSPLLFITIKVLPRRGRFVSIDVVVPQQIKIKMLASQIK